MTIRRWLAFGCTHAPFQDPEAIKFVVSQIRKHKPDVIVHLGDLYEADAASRWPSEDTHELHHEYREADKVLRRVRKAAPDARRVFLPGNHDANILAGNRIPLKLRALCDWRVPQHGPDGEFLNAELVTQWERPIDYRFCRDRGCWRLGQVVFSHGYKAGTNSDQKQCHRFCDDYGLLVTAHTHRPVPVTQARIAGVGAVSKWYANAGCTRDLDPEYIERNDASEWGHAVVVGEADISANQTTPASSRRWGAETRIMQTDLSRIPAV